MKGLKKRISKRPYTMLGGILIFALNVGSATATDHAFLIEHHKLLRAQALFDLNRQIEACESQLQPTAPFSISVQALQAQGIHFKGVLAALLVHSAWTNKPCMRQAKQTHIQRILEVQALENPGLDLAMNLASSGLALVMPSPEFLEAQSTYSQLKDEQRKYLDALFEGKKLTPSSISNLAELRSRL